MEDSQEPADSNHRPTLEETTDVSHRRSVASNPSNSSTSRDANPSSTRPQHHPNSYPPIIVLQEAPVNLPPEGAEERPGDQARPLNPLNPRHQRIMRTRNQERPLPLDAERLEHVVLHNAAMPPGFTASPQGGSSSTTDPPGKG